MKVTLVIDILTRDDKESFDLDELKGQKAPFAYHINYKNYGYAKFIIDAKSLGVLSLDLHKIECPMSRKQLYKIMEDMLRQNDMAGARLLDIIKEQLPQETDVGVITDLMSSLIPQIVNNYIPFELYSETHDELFQVILDEFLASGILKDDSTKHLVVEHLLSSVRNEDHYKLVIKWFEEGAVSTTMGEQIEGIKLSNKHKHEIMKIVWSSVEIPLIKKEQLMADLEASDTSDWLENTKRFCTAAHFENKEKIWNLIFSHEKNETDEWPLLTYVNTFRGWNQVKHYEFTERFEPRFFKEIERIIKFKGRFVAEAFFKLMRPMNKCTPEAIERYEKLLAKVRKEQPDNTFFINLLKDTITELKAKWQGRRASEQYLKPSSGVNVEVLKKVMKDMGGNGMQADSLKEIMRILNEGEDLGMEGGSLDAAFHLPDPSFALLVYVDVKPVRLDQFIDAIKIDARGSRKEDECFRFDVLRSKQNPNKFVFYEVYTNVAALNKHKTFDHFKPWMEFEESGGCFSVEAAVYDCLLDNADVADEEIVEEMVDPSLVMTVNIEVKPDRLDEFIRAMKHNAEESRQEPECFRFDILRNAENPCKFTLFEAYTNPAAHAKHKTTSHYKVWNDFKESGGVQSINTINYDGFDMTDFQPKDHTPKRDLS